MHILNKIFKIIYVMNILFIVISFIVLYIMYFNNKYENIDTFLFGIVIISLMVGSRFGILFFIINYIALLKYKKLRFLIICLILTPWILSSCLFIFDMV